MNRSGVNTFKVLALDGGGIKGTFMASIMAELERMAEKRMADHFDLITGTSTGGIIAIALGVGIPASQILRMYVEDGPKIFRTENTLSRASAFYGWLVKNKHDAGPLKDALVSVFGGKLLGESRTRLVIPAFNVVDGSVALFKTAHNEKYKQDYLRSCVDVALATSAAPSYFAAHVLVDGRTYVDGGVWANNPILIGALEALVCCGQSAEDVDILSIGATEEPFDLSERMRRGGGLWRWSKKQAELFLRAQSDAALKQAKLLLRHEPYRVSPVVTPSKYSFDDARSVADLRAMGADCARHHEANIGARFLDRVVTPFKPVWPRDRGAG